MPKTNRLIISGDVDHAMTTGFLRVLAEYANKPVTIYLNTDGGDCYQAREICALIKKHGNVTIHTFGACQSAGIFILCAAKHRVSSPSCSFLIHYGNSTSNSLSVKNHLDSLSLIEMDLVQKATNADLNEVRKWFNSEYAFGAEEALNINIVQKVAACL